MTFNREQAQQKLIEKAWQDAEFKAALVDNPKAIIASELGIEIHDEITIHVVEDSAETRHLVIPIPPESPGELNDDDLDEVEGGGCWGVTCRETTQVCGFITN